MKSPVAGHQRLGWPLPVRMDHPTFRGVAPPGHAPWYAIALAVCIWTGLISPSLALGIRHYCYAVPMRDGLALPTDVYLPRLPHGCYPAVLLRTPNGRESITKLQARMVCSKGFALVVQDMRGSRPGLGDEMLFVHDQADGHDTIQWIAAQPWCTGYVATWGPSAMGFAQNLLAPGAPPALRAQHVVMAFSNMYAQAAYQGGAFRKEMVEAWLADRYRGAQMLALVRSHRTYDDFWAVLNPETQAESVDAPAVFWGGWHDAFVEGTIRSFRTIHNQGGPGARGRCRLILGPWSHHDLRTLVDPRNAECFPQAADPLRFFRYWLEGEPNGVPCDAAVHYYVMGDPCDPAGATGWRTAENWPPPAVPVPLYLHTDGTLRRGVPAAPSSRAYRYDPQNPVPTLGGRNYALPAGPMDQRSVESRPDVLVFTSEQLTEPLEVVGMVEARLFISSDAPDTDFTVKLTDVYPDGRSMLVTDGILRASLREGFDREVPLSPGRVYDIRVEVGSTAYVFARGHRVRVAISSSNWPRFEANPNTGQPGHETVPPRVATNTLYLGDQHASHVILPVRHPTHDDRGASLAK